MLETVLKEIKERKYDAAIFSAAVSDYGPTKRKMGKTASKTEAWLIELKPLPKIIERVKHADSEILLVGFKAEYGVTDNELIERSYNRLREVGMDLIIANDVSREYSGFGHDTNEVFIINPEEEVEHIQLTDKKEIAEKILDILSTLLENKFPHANSQTASKD
jgi:phosphopantothenoylcysteine decarboxylase/phosphopantothenate--cysteine ligase